MYVQGSIDFTYSRSLSVSFISMGIYGFVAVHLLPIKWICRWRNVPFINAKPGNTTQNLQINISINQQNATQD